MRTIAEVVAVGLGMSTVSLSPADAQAHFGWFAMFAGLNMLASSAWTRAQLRWELAEPGLIADLQAMNYYSTRARA